MRSGPSTFSVVVLVIQPLTTSVWPVRIGVISEPMMTISTSFSAMPCFFISAFSSTLAVAWMPTFLPTRSLAVRTGFLGSEK